MRTRSKAREERKTEGKRSKGPDDTSCGVLKDVICGAVSLTDKRKKSRVKMLDIPCRATFDEVLGLLADAFGVTDGKQLRIGQLK